MSFNLPSDVQFIIDRLFTEGYRADVVGGPVRDFLMGRVPHDYDITTSASPDEVKRVFDGYRTVDTGIKHGTVTLVLNGENYEITTYRIDGEYRDSRRPESVTFTTELTEDLARRDFTMNAIAYNDRDGVTDPWGGREDIAARTIRAVREPHLRFNEDALRILRALRFASTLGFAVEEATRVAIFDTKDLLLNISSERIYSELYKLLSGDGAELIFTDYREVISVFLPELAGVCDLSGAFFYPDPETRLAALFYIALGEAASDVYSSAMRRLHTDAKTRSDGALALARVAKYDTSTELGVLRLLSDAGFSAARLALRIEVSAGIRDESALRILDRLVSHRAPYRPADLDLNGNDLIEIGITGAAIGRTMRVLLEQVMSRRLENRREALLTAAQRLYPVATDSDEGIATAEEKLPKKSY